MTSSVGMMKFPTEWKTMENFKKNETTNQYNIYIYIYIYSKQLRTEGDPLAIHAEITK